MARTVVAYWKIRIFPQGVSSSQREGLESGSIEWVDDPADADLILRENRSGGSALPERGTADAVRLTDRESDVLGYLADGWSNAEIASRMHIGTSTVKYHLAAMYRKMGVNRRTEAIREGQRMGAIEW